MAEGINGSVEYVQIGSNGNYKMTKDDERIIRRYIILLSDTASTEYLIRVMAYVFRTTLEDVHRILSETDGKELCELAMLRDKWRKNAERGLRYLPIGMRERQCESCEL